MKKEIVIIGGGFAGVNFIKEISGNNHFHVTLVDRNNYNFFPPLLYQVSTGFLEVSNISYPFRMLLSKHKNINFRMGELVEIKPKENQIVLSNGTLHYDYLIIATGTETNYFGMESIKEIALPMKTVNDAIELRNFLLQKNEDAILIKDEKEREKLTTIVITGGGPTGVEIAGMLAEMRTNIYQKDYPELSASKQKIYLIDGNPELLSPMTKKSQEYTLETLKKMGVKVWLNKKVVGYEDDQVLFESGEKIPSKILIWTAGVTSSVFDGLKKEDYGPGRRLIVDSVNRLKDYDNIYAIGDTSFQTSDPAFPKGHPQLAQVAIQQGKNLAKNLSRLQRKEEPLEFIYKDKGTMAIIGRSKAAADLPKPKIHFQGWLAWIMWLFVHLFSLISYRNRIKTMYNWTTSYFTKNQSMRMIIRSNAKKETAKK